MMIMYGTPETIAILGGEARSRKARGKNGKKK
jgi:hypothetical protein